MPGRPTAASEFRRGFDPYNLMVGALTAAALGAGDPGGDGDRRRARRPRPRRPVQALAAALTLFTIITALHTTAHTYFGWRFSRGIHAAESADHHRAVRLLAPVDRPGMSHYDPDGTAAGALASSRALLQSSEINRQAAGRSKPARS